MVQLGDLRRRPKLLSKEFVLTYRYVLIAFGLGLALISAGFVLEYFFTFEEQLEAARHPGRVMIAKPFVLTWKMVVVLALKEFGIACMVAGIIGLAIDKQAEERDIERAMALRKDIASDAVFALFGLKHDRAFIKAVIETNLEADIVRSGLNLKYSLRNLNEEEAKTVLPKDPEKALQRFVILHMTSSYTFQNVSSGEAPVIVKNSIARRRGAGARAVTRATYICLNGEEVPRDTIEDYLVSHEDDDQARYEWPRRLRAGEALHVIANVETLKERSDNEVWGSYYPTMAGLEIEFSPLPGMNFGVRENTNGTLIPIPGVPDKDGTKRWRLGSPLQRHHSLVFWWRIHEDDALDGTTPAAQYSEPQSPPQEAEHPKGSPHWFGHLWARFTSRK